MSLGELSLTAKLAFGFVAAVIVLFVREFIAEFNYKRKSKKFGGAKPLTLLDRPFGLPALFQLRAANSRNEVLQWVDGQVDESKNLRTARHQLAFDTVIITAEPDNIKAILATQFKDFSLGTRYWQLLPLLGEGIFTLSGDGWKHSRAMLRPQFSREQVSQINALTEHVDTLISLFHSKSKGGSEFFDCQVHYHQLTIDTATEFLFGESTDSLRDSKRLVQGPTRLVSASDFAECFNKCLDVLSLRTHLMNLYWLVDGFDFRRRVSICHNFVDYFVIKALEKPMHEGEVADRYVFINELTKETRDAKVIRDQAFNILLAGRDTTASLLAFITFYLARHKDVWHKLREAVLEEFGDSEETMSFESLKRCTYLTYVINEVLRLHPIVPLNFRTAEKDTLLPKGGGEDQTQPIFIPKGTKVIYSVYVTHRLKSLWGDDANEFRPDRWAEGKVRTWEYLPFNGGPRICLGQQYALTEVSFTLVKIIQNFKDIKFKGQVECDPLPMWTKLTASVANGCHVSFVPVDSKA